MPRKKETPQVDVTQLPNLAQMTASTIQEAYTEWMANNTPEKIKAQCTRTLDRSAEEILRKVLGFKKVWDNSWELDHCNGRSGNSVVGEYLKANQNAAVKAWLSQIPMPTLTKSMESSFARYAKEVFDRGVKQELTRLAEEYASEQAAKFFERIIQNQKAEFDQQLKLLELISQKKD